MVREKEDLRSRLDLSGSSGPLTEQKYQVRSFVAVSGFVEGTACPPGGGGGL